MARVGARPRRNRLFCGPCQVAPGVVRLPALVAGARRNDKPLARSASPDVTESEPGDQFQLVSLEALVRMKLAAFRDKDRTHLRDLIELGLVNASWLARVDPALRERLQLLLDTPEG